MFRFEDPTYLYALLLIPVLIVLRFLMVRQQQKRLRKFGDPELVKQLMPGVSRIRPAVKFYLLLFALALLIVMRARPQMGTKISHEKRTGIETIKRNNGLSILIKFYTMFHKKKYLNIQ